MTNRTIVKTTMDSAAVGFFGIGMTALYRALETDSTNALIIGFVAVVLGITIMAARHVWNQKSIDQMKQEEVDTNDKPVKIRRKKV